MKGRSQFNFTPSSRVVLYIRYGCFSTSCFNLDIDISCLKTFQGGISSGYKKFVQDNALTDNTYSEDGIALFRVQGTGPENMQAIQVESVRAEVVLMEKSLFYGYSLFFL